MVEYLQKIVKNCRALFARFFQKDLQRIFCVGQYGCDLEKRLDFFRRGCYYENLILQKHNTGLSSFKRYLKIEINNRKAMDLAC